MIKQASKFIPSITDNTEKLLEVKELKTYFFPSKDKEVKAVDNISFSINKGETVALVGESGSGKSVTSLSIMQLIPTPPGKILSGSIKLDGRELLSLSNKEMNKVRGKDIGMIFQEPTTSLDPVFTIGSQITESIRKHKKVSKKEAYENGVQLLKMVGFARAEEIMKEYPHQLSGGMRQRVMIAIAMSCEPKLLIADEPTTALDVTIQAQILDLLQEMKEHFNSSILLITHDMGVVAEVANRVLVMYGGQIVEEATVQEVFENPKHPYTVGLLNSIPDLDEDVERLEAIPGSVTPADQFPKGCRFASRCKFAMDICRQKTPELRQIKENHQARCFLHEGA
ncbi:ABC transporter ATP-binding protein [Ornithinibacillus scapharcae]|uniref:ABC transporter ATP-binding protein n=1 Tax=Ornithinibacillus scapharcae TaxID=1147159 RepID=UPI000225B9F5|nr:ABC transporter ATP-binding protein [Ornithinibacillus scapharcae]